MQRKQQVGECWVCVIFFASVCVGASNMTTTSDDPSSSALCVICTGSFPRGVPGGRGGGGGGAGMPPPPLVMCSVRKWAVAQGNAPKFFFGWYF
jgi:hypothetical protein